MCIYIYIRPFIMLSNNYKALWYETGLFHVPTEEQNPVPVLICGCSVTW